ncbi:hypothetical protein ABZ281_30445 [Streptomyces sp. NPDC006265]|uniref:hypothetical protein n=1 Tax=Streptomyces sp. NPDC006265 TaxID=3156740 RepID=UPI0033B77BC6
MGGHAARPGLGAPDLRADPRESDPVPVRADDALLRSAAVTAADVLVIPAADPLDTSDGSDGSEASGEDADIPVGGLGLLRWTYEPTAG